MSEAAVDIVDAGGEQTIDLAGKPTFPVGCQGNRFTLAQFGRQVADLDQLTGCLLSTSRCV